MKTNFEFNYSVSVAEYDRNKNEKETYKLRWKEREGTTETLINDIKNNRAFCACFYHNGDTFTNRDKSDSKLKSTNFIIYDMDAVKLTASDFYTIMQSTEIPPSIVYTTANNCKFKPNKNEEYNNRYRVIYLLDTPIVNASYYKEIHQTLKSEICSTIDDKNIYNDNSDSSVSHFFAGCRGGEIYSSDSVISLEWLSERYELSLEDNKKVSNGYIYSANEKPQGGYIISREGSNKSNFIRNTHINNDNNDLERVGKYVHYYFNKELEKVSDGYISNKKREEVLYNDVILFDNLDNSEFIEDYYDLDVSDIVKKYIYTFPSYESTQVNVDDNMLCYQLPKEYVEIRRFWYFDCYENDEGREYKTARVRKIKNGEGRRRKLFINLILRRLITPTISFEHLLYNAIFELYKYIDNTDNNDKITKVDIARITASAYFADMEKWSKLMQNEKRPKYKINKEYCVKHNLNARREALKLNSQNKRQEKIERAKLIAQYYDCGKTDKQNLEILKQNNITISLITLKRWRKENGYTKSKREKQTTSAYKAIERENNKKVEQQPTTTITSRESANNKQINEMKRESEQSNIKVMLDGSERELRISEIRSELFEGKTLTLTSNIIAIRAFNLNDDLSYTMAVSESEITPSFITTNKSDDVICFYVFGNEINEVEYSTISNQICEELKGCINELANERIVSVVNGYEYKRGQEFGCISNNIIYNTQWLISRYNAQ